jgi:hypothetical protein
MTATVRLRPDQMAELASAPQLRCTGCGQVTDALCFCGKPYEYVPAGKAAAKAIEAKPEMSNNAIAKDIGVSEPTVRRIRGSLKDEPGTRRRGKDGKSYPATKPKGPARKSTKGPAEQTFMDRVDQAIALAKVPFTGTLIEEAIELARSAEKAWSEAADKLEQRLKLEGQLKALN